MSLSKRFLPRYPGAATILGHRPTLTPAAIQDLWPGPTDQYPFLTSPQELEVVSSSALDTAGGDGIRAVFLHLIDSNWNKVQKVVATNGTTPVTVPDGPYYRCNRLTAESVGVAGVAVGEVDVRTSPGVTVIQRIIVNENDGEAGIWTIVPDDYPWGIISWKVKMLTGGNNTTAAADLVVRVANKADAPWFRLAIADVLTTDNRDDGDVIAPLTGSPNEAYDVVIRCTITGQSSPLSGNFTIVRKEPSITSFAEII